MTFTNAITTRSTVFTIDNSDETWTLADGQEIDSDTNGIYEGSSYHENTIQVSGDILVHAAFVGIVSHGTETAVAIGETGTVTGTFGVYGFGDQFRLVNDGAISGADTAVHIEGDRSRLINHGDIGGKIEAISADRLNMVFSKDSTVVNDLGNAIEISNGAGQNAHIVNKGTITAPDAHWAFLGGDGNETFINGGTVNGDIFLGAGDDMFDNRGGTMGAHYVGGGLGNDTYIISGKLDIHEIADGGTDTVKSTITTNFSTGDLAVQELENLTLLGAKKINGTGNVLDNAIKGNSADNILNGATGDDVLTGGKGDDIFIFNSSFGHDAITDFGLGNDRVNLSGLSGVTDFADLMANHVSKSGLDLVIHAGSDHLILEHVSKADLHASDFIF